MAVTFSGSTYLSTTSVPAGLNQNTALFSCSIWLYVTSFGGATITTDTGSGGTIIVVGDPSGSTYPDIIGPTPYAGDSTLYFEQAVNNYAEDNFLAGPTFSLNTWTHVAMTYNATTTVGYVNGAQVASGGIPLTTARPWKRVVIGGFNGDAQDAWLFNRVLTAAEVAQLYRQRHPRISRSSIVGYWPLASGGSAATDFSGNGRTLTATGSVTDASRSAPTNWGARVAATALRR